MREEIFKCNGIDINPLNVEDLQLSTSKMLLPETLYWLIRWIITGEQYSEPSFSSRASTSADERKILMTAQDLVHCASHARIKLPKHIGLGTSVKHLTGSKQLVPLLNRMGHCSSYDEKEQVETSLANESLAKADVSGVIIPTNINPGAFIQMAADNNDINEETTDGKNTTHATTLAIYQRKQYGPMPERLVDGEHSTKKRSLDSTQHLVVLDDVNMGGRRPGLPDFAGEVIGSWFTCDRHFLSTCMDDLCWILSWLATKYSPQKSRKYRDGVDSTPLHTLGSQ